MLASRPDTGKLTPTLYPLLGRADSGMMGPPIMHLFFTVIEQVR